MVVLLHHTPTCILHHFLSYLLCCVALGTPLLEDLGPFDRVSCWYVTHPGRLEEAGENGLSVQKPRLVPIM